MTSGESMVAVFVGVVHPVSGGWGLDGPLELTFSDSQWAVIVKASQIHVAVSGPRPTDFPTFANEVAAIVQGCVDSLGFELAVSLRCEITSIIVNGNEIIVPQPRWPELVDGNVRDRVEEEELTPLLNASVAHPLVRLALADIRVGMTSPDDTGFLAYRAVESVRQHFVDTDDTKLSRSRSWEELRTQLGVSEGETRRLEELARPRRHGEAIPLNAAERYEAMIIARRVIREFVLYLNRSP